MSNILGTPQGALGTLRTVATLRALRTLGPLGTLHTLRPLRTLGTKRALGAAGTCFAPRPGRARETLGSTGPWKPGRPRCSARAARP